MHPCSQCRHNANNEDCTTCPACLGISTTLKTRLTAALRQAVAPYVRTVDDGHINVNQWSQQDRTLVLPGDLILRGDKNSDVKQWKTWATATLDKCLTQIQRGWVMGNHESSQQASDDASKQIPSNNDNNNQDQEECGTLGVHAIIVPAAHVSRPSCVTTASHKNKQNNRKRRWRPTEAQSQGGDPRLHLEWRLAQTQPEGQQSMSSQLFTLNQAVHAKISADERQALLAQPLDDASDDTNYTPTPAYESLTPAVVPTKNSCAPRTTKKQNSTPELAKFLRAVAISTQEEQAQKNDSAKDASSMSAEELLAHRRERNRELAKQTRERKKNQLTSLKMQFESLMKENSKLQKIVYQHVQEPKAKNDTLIQAQQALLKVPENVWEVASGIELPTIVAHQRGQKSTKAAKEEPVVVVASNRVEILGNRLISVIFRVKSKS